MSKNDTVDRIRRVLDSNNITAYEIAKKTKLSEVGINRIKSGKIKNPNDSTIDILLEYLETNYGVSKTWLRTGEGIENLPVLPSDEQVLKMTKKEKERKLNEIATFMIKHESEMMENSLFNNFVEKIAYKIVIATLAENSGKKEG